MTITEVRSQVRETLGVTLTESQSTSITQAIFSLDEQVLFTMPPGKNAIYSDEDRYAVHIDVAKLLGVVSTVLGALIHPHEVDAAKAVALLATVFGLQGIVQRLEVDDAVLCRCLIAMSDRAGPCKFRGAPKKAISEYVEISSGSSWSTDRLETTLNRLRGKNVISETSSPTGPYICLKEFIIVRHPAIQGLRLSPF